MATLSKREEELFYSVLNPLLVHANGALRVHEGLETVGGLRDLDLLEAMELSNAAFEDRELLAGFVAENPAGLSEEGLELARSWVHALPGTFFVMEHGEEHSLLYDTERRLVLGVVGIQTELGDMMPVVPQVIETVLLPFRDRITYHGVLSPYNVVLGHGILRGLDEEFSSLMEEDGIRTTLPVEDEG